MVMCKYFLRGSCRFGETCKNEHTYNSVNADTTTSVMRKKGEIDTNALIKLVSNDMDKAEKGNQWPLSCYGPFQAKPCFPGFEDKCFEEIRLGIYEAEKNGTVEQYKQQLTQLLHEARMKMRSMQNPTAEATHVLQELYNANTSEQQTSNVFVNTNTFGNSTIQPNSVFNNTGGASKSIFNNQTPPSYTFAVPENKSIFGNTVPNANSIFAQTNQQNFASGGGIFSGNQIQQQQQQNQSFATINIFKTANNSIFGPQPGTTNSSNIFMQNNQPPNPFKQNIQVSVAGQSPYGVPNPTSFISNPNQATFAPNQSQATFTPNQPQPTFAPNQPQATFTPNQPQTTFTPNQPQATFTPNQPTFAPNQPQATFTPNQSPATFAPNQPQATFTPNQSPATFAPNQPQATFTPNQPQPSFTSIQSPFVGSFAPNPNQTTFTSTPPNPNPNQSLFVQPQSFGINQSPFTATTAAPVNQSPFAPTSTQTQFTTNQSPFGPPSGAITENRSIFGQNSQSSASDHSKSIFGSSQSTIVAAITKQDDPTVYSKLEALTENDVKSFEANTFEFGKIPDKPPTLQMCS